LVGSQGAWRGTPSIRSARYKRSSLGFNGGVAADRLLLSGSYPGALPLAGVEDRNPDAHEFRASAQDAANFDLIDDRDESTPVVDSRSDPTMSLGNVAKVDAVMTKSHGVIIPLIGKVADELDRFARANVLIDIAAAIDACR
jgi:hypothetical protein